MEGRLYFRPIVTCGNLSGASQRCSSSRVSQWKKKHDILLTLVVKPIAGYFSLAIAYEARGVRPSPPCFSPTAPCFASTSLTIVSVPRA